MLLRPLGSMHPTEPLACLHVVGWLLGMHVGHRYNCMQHPCICSSISAARGTPARKLTVVVTPIALNAIPDDRFKFSHNMEWVTAEAKVRIEMTRQHNKSFRDFRSRESGLAPSRWMFVTSAFSSLKKKQGKSEESS